MQSRNSVLKAIAGSTFGKDKETIITAYIAIGRPIINYAASVWLLQLCHTNWSHKTPNCESSLTLFLWLMLNTNILKRTSFQLKITINHLGDLKPAFQMIFFCHKNVVNREICADRCKLRKKK